MFDFERLEVYKKAKAVNAGIREFIKPANWIMPQAISIEASFSILNLAEGSGRFSKPDRRNFFTISRSSIFECIAILDVLKDESVIEEGAFYGFYGQELSKMLYAMIKNLQ